MSAVATVVGTGKHTYEVHEDWMRPPEGWEVMAASVTVDSKGRVYCFNRSQEHPVLIFDRDGNFVGHLHKLGTGHEDVPEANRQ